MIWHVFHRINHIQSKNVKDRHESTTANLFLYGPMYGTCFRFNDVVKDVACEAVEVRGTARWASPVSQTFTL